MVGSVFGSLCQFFFIVVRWSRVTRRRIKRWWWCGKKRNKMKTEGKKEGKGRREAAADS